VGAVCRELREQAGLTLLDLAVLDGSSPTQVQRFEQGGAGARKVERLVGVYAREFGVPEREIWTRAIERA
jgi:transcriptional regulator with XRE-family HTH domain